jgi:hypothetical protein
VNLWSNVQLTDNDSIPIIFEETSASKEADVLYLVHIFQEKFNFFSVIHFIIFEFILQAIYFT